MRAVVTLLAVIFMLAFVIAPALAHSQDATLQHLSVGGQLDLPADCICDCTERQRSWLAGKIAEMVPEALMQKFISNEL